MTQDEIIEMVREAGGSDVGGHGWTTWVGTQSTEFLERFAKLVAAREYERGFIDGMQKQMQSSVDKAVNAMSQRTWVGLTIEEIASCCRESTTTQLSFYNAIEAKLKEKNGA